MEAADYRGYCEDCKHQIETFTARHFDWRGAWRLNRQALGFDLLRAPVNVFWAPVWVVAQVFAWLCRRLRLPRVANALATLPPGLKTSVQAQVRADVDAEILRQRPQALSPLQQQIIERALDRYITARQATAEISANIGILVVGFLIFDAFTPGGLGVGQMLAENVAWYAAVQDFWLGSSFGRLWYGWFPPDTPLWLTIVGIVIGLSLIALLAAFSGLVSDPIQRLFRLHQRRLRRMMAAIERDLQASNETGFRISEPFWARLMDGLDWLKFGL